jgi:hypothetical protein
MKKGWFLFCLFLFGTVIEAKTSYSILVLGDEYSKVSLTQSGQAWPTLLKKRIETQFLFSPYVEVIAENNWNTQDLDSALSAKSFRSDFDLVIVMIGLHDALSDGPTAYYKKPLKKLWEKVLNAVGGDPTKVAIFSIPDWTCSSEAKEKNKSETLLSLKKSFDRYNLLIATEAVSLGFRYFDIAEMTRDVDETGFVSGSTIYNSKLTQMWVELLIPTIEKMIKNKMSR